MINRRKLMQTTVAAGVVAAGTTLPGLRAVAQATPPLRRSLTGMDLDDQVLKTLREFVAMMSDSSRDGQPVSWKGFADIHGSNPPNRFNLCPHGNWYFVPWHRGYVHMYEVAARQLTGDMDFAMPYWDWFDDPTFPAAFGDEQIDGVDNPLFLPGRSMTTGDRVQDQFINASVKDTVYGSQTYQEFGSTMPRGQDSLDQVWITRQGTATELEANPHGNIHCQIFNPFMCFGNSPMDPIFQMHHGNIDRIWDEWNSLGGPNETNALWTDMEFMDNYIAPDGSSYGLKVSDMLDVDALGYTYGYQQPGDTNTIDPARLLYLSSLWNGSSGFGSVDLTQALALTDAEVSASAPLNAEINTSLLALAPAVDSAATNALQVAGLARQHVYGFVRGVTATAPDATEVNVFVNLPDASGDTPVANNNHYVTTLGLFGVGGHGDGHGDHGGGHDFMLDLTPALKRLAAEGGLQTDSVSIQIVAAPLTPDSDPGSITVKEIEVAVV